MGDDIADPMEQHERAGVTIDVWDRNRKFVVMIPPEQIVTPDRHFRDDPIKAGLEDL